MLRIFRKKKDDESTDQSGLESVQLRPVEKSGQDPLEARLQRTRAGLGQKLQALIAGRSQVDEALLTDIEETLLQADLGIATTMGLMDSLRDGLNSGVVSEPADVLPAVQAELYALLEPCEAFLQVDVEKKPFVILMVGVNGVGKTTTIGKLAQRFIEDGLSVMLAAGDTFRAAAVEQLQEWGRRAEVPVIAQAPGADSAAVVFDALQSARSRGIDVLIADTAGRLHTQGGLMDELSKVKRVLGKQDPEAPHEVMLVLDAGNGQNALNQAKQFNEAVGVTGITLTKLDGTARGGVVAAIAKEMQLPIRFIGVGESSRDLRPFDAGTFIHAILPVEET